MNLKIVTSWKGKTYKANTISDFLKVLKRFYTWHAKNKHTKIPHERMQYIKAPGRDPMTTTASDLLTLDEQDADRALLMTLSEVRSVSVKSGGSSGEISNLMNTGSSQMYHSRPISPRISG